MLLADEYCYGPPPTPSNIFLYLGKPGEALPGDFYLGKSGAFPTFCTYENLVGPSTGPSPTTCT